MSIMDDYKQLRMIENIKNSKEMETAYNANLKLCKYQEQQINKLATCIEEIKEIAEEQQSWNEWNSKHSETESEDDIFAYNWSALKQILQKISEVE